MGFLIGLADRPPLATMCGFFVSHVFSMLCAWVFQSGLADRPLLVAMCLFVVVVHLCFQCYTHGFC